MLVTPDHQIDRFAGHNELLSYSGQPVVRPTVSSTHVSDYDQRICLGHDLIVIVQDRRGQIFEYQAFRRAEQGDFRCFLACQTQNAKSDRALSRAHFHDFVSLRPGWKIPFGSFQDDVSSKPWEIGLVHARLQLFLAFIELMVTKDGQIVAHQVVHVDGAYSHQQLRDGWRGEINIPGIEQSHILSTQSGADIVNLIRNVSRAAAPD